MVVEVTYRMPANGLGTDFTEFDRPISFAPIYTNRFRNITGAAERRPGMLIHADAQVPGAPNLTRLHEFVSNTGDETLLSSDDFGNIYKMATSAWTTALTGKANARMISAEANSKLIFVNGVDRNFYTADGGVTFAELKALITTGKLAGGSGPTTVIDGNVSNWIGATLVANNDIVHNITRNGYGIVTAVASASLTTTGIGSSFHGAGFTSNQAPGDVYELIDYVDLNIIPQGASNQSDGLPLDNVATATTGTTQDVIVVSGVNFANTQIRTGDIVYNTTRATIAHISTISANVNVLESITSQVAGDALVFFKSAMPIASWVHVHYGRVYFIDSRNQTSVVITAPDDPQDVTTFAKTLDSTSFSFATQQPPGDILLSLHSFLSYFVASGKKNLYIYQGNTPIQDTSTTTLNFTPIAFSPHGVASRFGLETNGGDLLHITVDGLRSVSIGYNAFNAVQQNISVPIRTALRNAIQNVTNTDNIQLSYYPRRSWLINKIGDLAYVLNTNPSYDDSGAQQNIQSWHLFSGLWAQQNHYFVRRSGDLYACGANGYVYEMDASAATDVGTAIATDLQTAWLRLEEPQRTRRIKELLYIEPIFESGSDIVYSISAIAGLDALSNDTIDVAVSGLGGSIGDQVIGTFVIGAGEYAEASKYPLRVRGEEMRIEFTTESTGFPDTITGFSLLGNIAGRR